MCTCVRVRARFPVLAAVYKCVGQHSLCGVHPLTLQVFLHLITEMELVASFVLFVLRFANAVNVNGPSLDKLTWLF